MRLIVCLYSNLWPLNHTIFVFQDLLYNIKAKSGFLYHKIKNNKMRTAKQATDFNEEELIEFLKQCVVSNDHKKLKGKLCETVPLRRRLLKENGDDFRAFLKFYFVDPTLVQFAIFLPF